MPLSRLCLSLTQVARAAWVTVAVLSLTACDYRDGPPADPGTSPSTASVTLSWSAPAQNADGTPLQDLAGYRIYYSQAPWGWANSLNVSDPRATTIEIPNLATGATWYFAMTSYNVAGVESERTGYVSKML